MSKIKEEFITDLADRLLIGLDLEEKKYVTDTIEEIDSLSEVMGEVEGLDKVEPMTHTLDDFEYVLREDELEENPSIEDLLRNCDDTEDREVVVPKVIG